MILWMTRKSFLDTAEDLPTPLLVQAVENSATLVEDILSPESNLDRRDPAVRMWEGNEVALAAYSAAGSVELARRGIHNTTHLRVAQTIESLRNWEDGIFEFPSWIEDVDILRAYRSNLVRRWPKEFAIKWKGTPANWPYLWCFMEPNGRYKIMVSKDDKQLLQKGLRTLPKSVTQKVANL